ncbi:glycosyltransferase family 2 protein [Labilibacter marinus]|uniref:glycosyltransferase family 2 protein n=1 Tax=Labilibacter marinus TaxID=1477105 RepID=UPI00094F8E62|nr:glycosyltransferase family 2 protein [Labilibacter marinus]
MKNLKISIITPSFNQGKFLEETILSVLDQNYPKLEYIIIDGGSTDNSVDIIKKHQDKLAYWISEKDDGQSHAINKGFQKATGDIICWLNSDDLLQPDTLKLVSDQFKNKQTNWLTGNCSTIDAQSKTIGSYTCNIPPSNKEWLNHFARGASFAILQPSTFWKKEIIDKVGLLNQKLHYSFDHEYFLRMYLQFGKPNVINKNLSAFRLHDESKTVSTKEAFHKENRKIARNYISHLPIKEQVYLWAVYCFKGK